MSDRHAKKVQNACPACAVPMIAYELTGIEIDHCIQCLGTWLDEGEIEAIAELAGVDPGPFQSVLDAPRRTGTKSEKPCPRCRRRLRTGDVSAEGASVEIDRCDRGCGLWLDRGEMKDLLEVFHEDEEGAIAAFFKDLYRSELEEPHAADEKHGRSEKRSRES